MSVLVLSVVEITCDHPGCDADYLTDPPYRAATDRARADGWSIGNSPIKGRPPVVGCPAHRRTRGSPRWIGRPEAAPES